VGDDELANSTADTPYDAYASGANSPDNNGIDSADGLVVQQDPALPKQPLSTFIRTDTNVLKDDEQCLELALKRNDTLTLIGEYTVQVLSPSGILEVAGTILKPKAAPTRIYALSTQALPQLCCTHAATIRLSSVDSGLRQLEKLSPLFRNIGPVAEGDGGRSFQLLRYAQDDPLQRSLTVLEIDQTWEKVATYLANENFTPRKPNTRVMAIGAKSSGKSTFNRLLCNSILSRLPNTAHGVLFLDLDPGQPEFTPAGQISLVRIRAPTLGPAYTHPAAASPNFGFQLVRSHTLASTSFKDDPDLYKACALDLISHAEAGVPIVMNSSGWVTGLGASVLVDLVSALGVSDVILLEPLDEALTTSLKQNAGSRTKIQQVPRHAHGPSPRTPAEMRAMLAMGYFHHKPVARSSSFVCRWSGRPLSRIRPWIVRYAGPDRGVKAVLSYGQSPDPEFLAEVLDGAVVAVVVLDSNVLITNTNAKVDQLFLDSSAANFVQRSDEGLASTLDEMVEYTPEKGIPYIPPHPLLINRSLNPRQSHCIGLAFIRAIDGENQIFHLLTPLPEPQIAELKGKDVVLVRGGFDPAEWAYLEDVYAARHGGFEFEDDGEVEVERPWLCARERVGIEGAVWRLRHPPLVRGGRGQ